MARRRYYRRRRRADDRLALIGVAILVVVMAIIGAVRAHPLAATSVLLALVAGGGAWLYRRFTGARQLRDWERDIAITDQMTGSQFEHYVARLMRASGCRGVRVQGGAGDMGADVTGTAPDGRRIVVQCKRHKNNLTSPHVQRFAGTVWDIHGADVALLVTTTSVTAPAWDVARRCRITLVDRAALARWAGTQVPPIDQWPVPRTQMPGSSAAATGPAAPDADGLAI